METEFQGAKIIGSKISKVLLRKSVADDHKWLHGYSVSVYDFENNRFCAWTMTWAYQCRPWNSNTLNVGLVDNGRTCSSMLLDMMVDEARSWQKWVWWSLMVVMIMIMSTHKLGPLLYVASAHGWLMLHVISDLCGGSWLGHCGHNRLVSFFICNFLVSLYALDPHVKISGVGNILITPSFWILRL
jgi:hypothetical protein